MKHYPANRYHPDLQGVSHTRAPYRPPLLIVAALFFVLGFAAAVWTVGMIVTAP